MVADRDRSHSQLLVQRGAAFTLAGGPEYLSSSEDDAEDHTGNRSATSRKDKDAKPKTILSATRDNTGLHLYRISLTRKRLSMEEDVQPLISRDDLFNVVLPDVFDVYSSSDEDAADAESRAKRDVMCALPSAFPPSSSTSNRKAAKDHRAAFSSAPRRDGDGSPETLMTRQKIKRRKKRPRRVAWKEAKTQRRVVCFNRTWRKTAEGLLESLLGNSCQPVVWEDEEQPSKKTTTASVSVCKSKNTGNKTNGAAAVMEHECANGSKKAFCLDDLMERYEIFRTLIWSKMSDPKTLGECLTACGSRSSLFAALSAIVGREVRKQDSQTSGDIFDSGGSGGQPQRRKTAKEKALLRKLRKWVLLPWQRLGPRIATLREMRFVLQELFDLVSSNDAFTIDSTDNELLDLLCAGNDDSRNVDDVVGKNRNHGQGHSESSKAASAASHQVSGSVRYECRDVMRAGGENTGGKSQRAGRCQKVTRILETNAAEIVRNVHTAHAKGALGSTRITQSRLVLPHRKNDSVGVDGAHEEEDCSTTHTAVNSYIEDGENYAAETVLFDFNPARLRPMKKQLCLRAPAGGEKLPVYTERADLEVLHKKGKKGVKNNMPDTSDGEHASDRSAYDPTRDGNKRDAAQHRGPSSSPSPKRSALTGEVIDEEKEKRHRFRFGKDDTATLIGKSTVRMTKELTDVLGGVFNLSGDEAEDDAGGGDGISMGVGGAGPSSMASGGGHGCNGSATMFAKNRCLVPFFHVLCQNGPTDLLEDLIRLWDRGDLHALERFVLPDELHPQPEYHALAFEEQEARARLRGRTLASGLGSPKAHAHNQGQSDLGFDDEASTVKNLPVYSASTGDKSSKAIIDIDSIYDGSVRLLTENEVAQIAAAGDLASSMITDAAARGKTAKRTPCCRSPAESVRDSKATPTSSPSSLNKKSPMRATFVRGIAADTSIPLGERLDAHDAWLKRTVFLATPMHAAAKGGRIDVCRMLLQCEVDALRRDSYFGPKGRAGRRFAQNFSGILEARDQKGWTPLLNACERNELPMVRFLLRQRASPNTRGSVRGETPLYLATVRGSVPLVKLLLEWDRRQATLSLDPDGRVVVAVARSGSAIKETCASMPPINKSADTVVTSSASSFYEDLVGTQDVAKVDDVFDREDDDPPIVDTSLLETSMQDSESEASPSEDAKSSAAGSQVSSRRKSDEKTSINEVQSLMMNNSPDSRKQPRSKRTRNAAVSAPNYAALVRGENDGYLDDYFRDVAVFGKTDDGGSSSDNSLFSDENMAMSVPRRTRAAEVSRSGATALRRGAGSFGNNTKTSASKAEGFVFPRLDLNPRITQTGETPLARACWDGDAEIAKLLLETLVSASSNQKEEQTQPPDMRNNPQETNRVHINTRDGAGRTPLLHAIMGAKPAQMLKLLLDYRFSQQPRRDPSRRKRRQSKNIAGTMNNSKGAHQQQLSVSPEKTTAVIPTKLLSPRRQRQMHFGKDAVFADDAALELPDNSPFRRKPGSWKADLGSPMNKLSASPSGRGTLLPALVPPLYKEDFGNEVGEMGKSPGTGNLFSPKANRGDLVVTAVDSSDEKSPHTALPGYLLPAEEEVLDLNTKLVVSGRTALSLAVDFENHAEALVKTLLTADLIFQHLPARLTRGHAPLDVNAADVLGESALFKAVDAGRLKLVKLLLSHNSIDVNQRVLLPVDQISGKSKRTPVAAEAEAPVEADAADKNAKGDDAADEGSPPSAVVSSTSKKAVHFAGNEDAKKNKKHKEGVSAKKKKRKKIKGRDVTRSGSDSSSSSSSSSSSRRPKRGKRRKNMTRDSSPDSDGTSGVIQKALKLVDTREGSHRASDPDSVEDSSPPKGSPIREKSSGEGIAGAAAVTSKTIADLSPGGRTRGSATTPVQGATAAPVTRKTIPDLAFFNRNSPTRKSSPGGKTKKSDGSTRPPAKKPPPKRQHPSEGKTPFLRAVELRNVALVQAFLTWDQHLRDANFFLPEDLVAIATKQEAQTAQEIAIAEGERTEAQRKDGVQGLYVLGGEQALKQRVADEFRAQGEDVSDALEEGGSSPDTGSPTSATHKAGKNGSSPSTAAKQTKGGNTQKSKKATLKDLDPPPPEIPDFRSEEPVLQDKIEFWNSEIAQIFRLTVIVGKKVSYTSRALRSWHGKKWDTAQVVKIHNWHDEDVATTASKEQKSLSSSSVNDIRITLEQETGRGGTKQFHVARHQIKEIADAERIKRERVKSFLNARVKQRATREQAKGDALKILMETMVEQDAQLASQSKRNKYLRDTTAAQRKTHEEDFDPDAATLLGVDVLAVDANLVRRVYAEERERREREKWNEKAAVDGEADDVIDIDHEANMSRKPNAALPDDAVVAKNVDSGASPKTASRSSKQERRKRKLLEARYSRPLDPNCQDLYTGKTPLILAVEAQDMEIISLLLSHPFCDLYRTCYEGMTAKMHALLQPIGMNRDRIVTMLDKERLQ
ncbi:unnamed protein product [Amoebophrya sp. A25]|nr:unnamed protein product [Amoebophrya sp. A25]|eukprot:GSA25T00005656001.1